MLFNSPIFIFLFVPVTFIGFYALGRRTGHGMAAIWLLFASLVFYAYWRPPYLILLGASIIVNFWIGAYLNGQRPYREQMLAAGIVANLLLLGYYKYTNFLVSNVNALFASQGVRFNPGDIALPLAISFFTFQQIAYLVDAYRRETHEYRFFNYALFVSFFPQLVAGPIVHHKEMMPQFSRQDSSRINWNDVASGLTMFSIGLFKKVVIADTFAIFATAIFSQAERTFPPPDISFFPAWGGALAYTFQLYFDFSGYSDMALGLARLFGIQLPINFNSPYKAANIIDFWRRWHMTLSRFLRDYLYIPLGGNRRGKTRRYVNLMTTMLLGGLWHGASWNFVLWGGLHGIYLVINNLWRAVPLSRRLAEQDRFSYRVLCIGATFLITVIAWVPFRAPSLAGAGKIYAGMIGSNGISLPAEWLQILGRSDTLTLIFGEFGVTFDASLTAGVVSQLAMLVLGAGIVFGCPNVAELFEMFDYRVSRWWNRARFVVSYRWALYTTGISAASIMLILAHRVSEFLYFEF